VASRIAGSSDLYQANLRLPINSINFVTCHDGFTLWDLVSYEQKRNEANGEDNRDGCNNGLTWNCGVEGETDDPEILALRRRQAKNFLALLFLSQGVPMLLAGDEVLRSQRGNNNAWCQNNPVAWFDWALTERNADMLRFVSEIIALRKRHRTLQRRRFLTGRRTSSGNQPDITWHGTALDEPQWDDPDCRALAFTLTGIDEGEDDLHILVNTGEEPRLFELPTLPDRSWHLAVDTCRPTPEDIAAPLEQRMVSEAIYRVMARSLVVMEGR
jgi:isoamylase